MSYSDRRAANFFWWVRRWRLWDFFGVEVCEFLEVLLGDE